MSLRTSAQTDSVDKVNYEKVIQKTLTVDFSTGILWRGMAQAKSPATTITAGLKKGNFYLNWIGVETVDNSFNDVTWEIGYNRSISNLIYHVGFTDNYFPFLKRSYFNYGNNLNSGHLLELNASVSGNARVPLTVFYSFYLHNRVVEDSVCASYLKLSYELTLNKNIVLPVAGFVLNKSANLYAADHAGLLNYGCTFSRKMAFSKQHTIRLDFTWTTHTQLKTNNFALLASFKL